jgi:hypothetical protein
VAVVALVRFYVHTVRGALALDLGMCRSIRPRSPLRMHVAAPRVIVFDLIAQPYLGKTPRALRDKLQVLERGSDLALAVHFTDVGRGVTATTVEAVRFERPERIAFRLVRAPVPRVLQTYELRDLDREEDFEYRGELSADPLGAWLVVGRASGSPGRAGRCPRRTAQAQSASARRFGGALPLARRAVGRLELAELPVEHRRAHHPPRRPHTRPRRARPSPRVVSSSPKSARAPAL